MLDIFEKNAENKNKTVDSYELIARGTLIVLLVALIAVLLPVIILSIVVTLFLLLINKFKSIKYIKLIMGFLFTIFCICIGTKFKSITAFSNIIEIPIITQFLESKLNHSWFERDFISYITLFSLSSFLGLVLFLLLEFYKNRKVVSKEEKNNKKKSLKDVNDKKIYSKNLKIQRDYRLSDNTECLVGLENSDKPLYISKTELNTHALVVGTTGSGKTILLLNAIESFIKSNEPTIVIDGKGDPLTIKQIKNLADEYNRSVYVFNEKYDLTYNPLKNGNRTVVVDRLMNIFDWSEQYYEAQARNILLKILMLIDEYNLSRDLETLSKMLNIDNIKELLANDYLYKKKVYKKKIEVAEDEKDEDLDIDNMSLSEKKEYYKNRSKEKEYKEVEVEEKVKVFSDKYHRFVEMFFGVDSLSDLEKSDLNKIKESYSKRFNGLQSQIENLLLTDIGNLVMDKPNGLDLNKVIEENAVLIFSFETVKYPQFMKTFSRFVIEDIASVMSEQFDNNKKVLLIADEFGAYGTNRIVDLLARLRSAGLHAIVGTQTINDLIVDGIDLSGKIFGNTNTYMIGKINSDDDADRLSKVFGTYEDIEKTIQTEDSVESKFIRRDVRAEKGTIRNVNKFYIKPDEFKELPNYTFIIYRKSKKSLKHEEKYSKVYVRNNQDGLLKEGIK
ncbi:type IV secretory system conjugative DNA transfer family protein [Staphylococcus aureus]|uniref:type IV secretory system conjugative DNA transfer family protein n=1 Tax=Staphylococcus aureus TaxID=1280 RepID=UPI002112DA81|nr:helicase HerA-like domain-containing protein [Staphylococcus aureus]MCQ6827888.1 DUF853 family protein [Staphylococcus aureus]